MLASSEERGPTHVGSEWEPPARRLKPLPPHVALVSHPLPPTPEPLRPAHTRDRQAVLLNPYHGYKMHPHPQRPPPKIQAFEQDLAHNRSRDSP